VNKERYSLSQKYIKPLYSEHQITKLISIANRATSLYEMFWPTAMSEENQALLVMNASLLVTDAIVSEERKSVHHQLLSEVGSNFMINFI